MCKLGPTTTAAVCAVLSMTRANSQLQFNEVVMDVTKSMVRLCQLFRSLVGVGMNKFFSTMFFVSGERKN